MVPDVGFELTTYCLQDSCSTTELIRLKKQNSEEESRGRFLVGRDF